MAAVEKVYALHDFDAENPDEVSFKAGEAVIVVEKDDAYGDGWWQGTNLRGETGLFPFSYTTFDAEAAKGSAAAAAAGGAGAPDVAAVGGTTTGANGKVMNTTMADIDEALAGLRTGNGKGPAKGISADRRSVDSERTGDFSMGDTDENGDNAEDDLQARAKARAALAVNAAKDQEETDEAEREEQARMKAQAQRIFEEEEEKQRQLLLKREEERKVAAAQGTLPETDKVKVAPIAGLDMSDDSDSEGSEGPDFDDGVAAPTHAPLFGGPAVASSAASGTPMASEALRSVGASPAPVGSVGATPKDGTNASLEQQQGQPQRSLSPIASSVGTHSQGGADQTALFAGASAAAAAGIAAGSYAGSRQSASGAKANASAMPGSGPAAPDSVASYDQRSISSSKGRTSTVADSPAMGTFGSTGPGNGTSVGTAPTSVLGTETPKSQHTAAAQQSPSPSVAGSRQQHAAPGGDPRDWTVDDVVAWGRSKGWDEAQVVSKFAEHEISGDVLLEMDVNILKEIDITAFGKRFQVSNAIKELNKSLQGGGGVADASPMSGWPGTPDGSSGPGTVAPGGVFHQQQQQPPQQRAYNLSNDSPSAPPTFTVPGRASSTSQPFGPPSGLHSGPPTAHSPYFDIVQPSNDTEAMGAPAAPSGWTQSPMIGRPSQDRDLAQTEGEPVSALKSEGRRSSLRTTSEDASLNNVLTAANPAARKRESAGSGSGKVSGDRSSFFAGFHGQKGRKPAPRVQSQTPTESSDGNKGTFSRLGFNRLKTGTTPNEVGTPTSDLRNKISLPTSSPTYDAMGDTARRTRASQLSSGSAGGPQGNGGLSRGGGPGAGGYMGHQKQASVGSAGQNAADWHSPGNAGGQQTTPGGGTAEGPVMLRIRPVDREGWMRKKGERYNSWKPRYLALKGSDLVLLRDPSAAKIKGYVSMKGYKVIADENTNPGKYGFKILHETEKPHYFSSDDSIVVREWMKALMKATIDRDTSLPVISSYNNATISLKEAQRMNPPPRPPSPTSRARAQRATARANKDQLTAKDASVLMGLHQSGDARQKGL